MQVAIVVSA